MTDYREYSIEVERIERQTVTFVVDVITDNDALTRIALAHCDPDDWSDTEYRRTNLTSKRVRVTPEDPA